jgi:dienelactone hydrolase
MKLLALLAFALLASPVLAAIKVEPIDYKDGDVALRGYIAYDDAWTDKHPAVLVVHEWWGNNEYAQGRAKKLAELGYVAFALDMYGKDKTTDNPQKAGEFSQAIGGDPAVMRRRATAGLKVLQDFRLTDTSRVAAIGYCFGGTVVMELARTGADLKAVVPFHASKIAATNPADNKEIRGKILVCNGAEDTFISKEERAKFATQMKEAGLDYQFIDYSGAVHAFTNPGAGKYNMPGVKYNEAADRRSWALMQALFNEVFGSHRQGLAPHPAPQPRVRDIV